MANSKKSDETPPMAGSRLVSIVERALENGAVIGGLIYQTEDGSIGYQFTEEANPEQIIYMLRYAEMRFMMGAVVEGEDEDEDNFND